MKTNLSMEELEALKIFDPNGCLEDFAAFWESEDILECNYCSYCEGEQSVVYSVGIELENGVMLGGDDLGDNILYPESVVSTLTDIMTHLDAYIDNEDDLAPVSDITYGEFCACCLECMD